MKKMKLILCLMVLVLGASLSFAQAPVVNAGWEAFIIRENAIEGPPLIEYNDAYGEVALEFVTFAGSQKSGLGTNQINGALIGQIATLHVDRLDDPASSGSEWGPYFNIWITDGLGNYAVVANEPSDAEWAGSRWDVADWAFLSTKRAKVYETPGWNSNTSWVHNYVGHGDPLTFSDIAGLAVEPPPPAYIQNPANGVGSGAPDELGTEIAYGYNWIFGDTMSNYVSGDEGFVVNNYYATTDFNVVNVTQATTYSTIEAALAAANPSDSITVADGTYNPVGSLVINQALTLSGESEAGVIINIPAAGGYGFSVAASDVTMENFTLAAEAGNENYPIHASGTSNSPTGFDFLTINNVTVSGAHRRAGVDVHGYNHVILSNVASSDAWGGNGVQITGCVDVDMDNITSLNNAWGSIAIYCSNVGYLGRGSDDVQIDGTTLVTDGAIFSQNEFGFLNTNIVIPGWEYLVMNNHFREGLGYSDSEGYAFFAPDQPTAMGIALAFVGYEQNSALRNTTSGALEVYPGLTLQAAVEHADLVDSVDIGAGTVLIPSQVRIDKDLTITGSGNTTTTLAAAFATPGGSYSDTSSLIFMDLGVTVVMSDLAIDGTGFAVKQAIQSRGADVTVQDCIVTNMMASTYDGRGIVFLTGIGLVKDCEISGAQRIGVHIRGGAIGEPSPVVAVDGLTYTGKGVGDWLDYGVEFGGGGQGSVTNSVINDCVGVAVSDGSTSGGILVTDYYGTGTVADITNSVITGNTSGVVVGYDVSDISLCTIHGCDLSGNADLGASSTGVEVDALGNWWGASSGPFHPSTNPLGSGVEVSDNVLYDPWMGLGVVTAAPAASGPLTCGQSVTMTFSLTMDAYTPDVFGFNAVVRNTSEVNLMGIASLNVFGGTTQFFTFDNGDGSFTLSGTTQGNPTQPISGEGTYGLFTIVYSTVSDGTADITFDSFILRDPNNQPIGASATGATIDVDCTAPAAVTDIQADPHHNKVAVSWAHDGLDTDHYEIYRGLWYDTAVGTSAYPEYDDLANDVTPTHPSNRTVATASLEWVLAGTVPAGTLTFDDVWPDETSRGVYYYEVFAVDDPLPAGNNSLAAATNDRATNYWLGDMNANGEVAVYDMSVLGGAFGTTEAGGGGYYAYADVGPTDDSSRVGIPATDNSIDFEDLMIFSMNFGVVSDINKSEATISSSADLSWVDYGVGRYALRLNQATGLKGVHLRATLPEGASVTVTAGELLDQQSQMTFLRNIGEGLDVNLAVTGVGNGFVGQGDLFLIESSVELTMADLIIDLRGSDNSNLEVKLDNESGTLTPRVFALKAAYPNPFNPLTKISFSLPEQQSVRLKVYGIDGKLIRTLVDETRGAGLHEVIWNGQNDTGQVQASGLYFYRIEAGPYSQVRKMTLMK